MPRIARWNALESVDLLAREGILFLSGRSHGQVRRYLAKPGDEVEELAAVRHEKIV